MLGVLRLTEADLFPDDRKPEAGPVERRIVAAYDYTDEAGELLYQAVRYSPKTFRQRRPDGDDGWLYDLNGTRRVPYRLPELVEGVKGKRWVIVTEGEKDADALAALGFVSTTNPMGAGKWDDTYSEHLRGAKVCIVSDADTPGRKHAEQVARSVAKVAATLVVLEIDGLPEKGDLSDWLDAGGTAEELKALIRSAKPWEPAPDRASDNDSMDELFGPRLLSRWASDITPTRPEWLWRYWIARGVVQLLAGKQGLGKSTFAAWLVAALTTGRPFPSEGDGRPPMTCAALSFEEAADRVVARLDAAGADLSRVLVLDDVEDVDKDGNRYRRPWRLPRDCALLERKLAEAGVGFCVIDGLGHSVEGDGNNYGVVGAALSALAKVAERTHATILGLTHTPKGSAEAVTAAIGSTAWTALARIGWVLGMDPNDENRLVVQAPKTGYLKPPHGWGFRIVTDAAGWECGVVVDLVESHVDADDLTAARGTSEERSDRAEARNLLRRLLPRDTKEVQQAAEAMGISTATLRRARKDLGVTSEEERDPSTGKVLRWVLHLSADQALTPSASEGGEPLDPLALTRENDAGGGPGAHLRESEPLDLWSRYGNDHDECFGCGGAAVRQARDGTPRCPTCPDALAVVGDCQPGPT